MPPIAANDNHPRDPEFDRKLLAYEPAIRKMVRRIAGHDQAAEELFQQAMLMMLRRHQNCRIETFWTWAVFNVRNAAQEYVKHQSTMKRTAEVCSLSSFDEMPGSTEAAQEDSAELSFVLGLLKGREGDMTLRVAMGDTLEAIGRDYGLGRERVRQLVERERARVSALLEASNA